MYVRDCHIENVGPIRFLDFQFPMSSTGSPMPVVLLGENGTGKSTLLSMIADALLLFQQKVFGDIVPGQTYGSGAFLRAIGGATQTVTTKYGISALRFAGQEANAYWIEKTGDLPKDVALGSLSERFGEIPLKMALASEVYKDIDVLIKDRALSKDFKDNSYCFFPSDRGDQPAWMNEESHPAKTAFRFRSQFDSRLDKPLYISSSIDSCLPWLMDVILDARVDAESAPDGHAVIFSLPTDEAERWLRSKSLLESLTGFLQILLDDPSAHFEIGPRGSSDFRLQIVRDEIERSMPSITCLSAGQATLFGMFATILRYSDRGVDRINGDLSAVHGIVLVDEADAHLHTRLQYEALPIMISKLPNVQFVLTSHSPVLLLGMEKQFGPKGFLAMEMPLGVPCNSDDYPEAAMTVRCFAETKEFRDVLAAKLKETVPMPRVFMEGKTDVRYTETAFRVLGHGETLTRVRLDTFATTGSLGDVNGGLSSLKKVEDLYKTTRLFSEPVLLLYDCDAQRPDSEGNGLAVRSVCKNPNSIIKRGIENLLPDGVIAHDEYYTRHSTTNDYGGAVFHEDLKKEKLSEDLCNTADPTVFEIFLPIVETIENWLNSIPGTQSQLVSAGKDSA